MRRNCVAEGEGGCWRRNERRKRGGGGGGGGENADVYKLLNDRRCERRYLDKFNSRYSQRQPLGIF